MTMAPESVVRREAAVRAAAAQGLVGAQAPVLGLLDVEGIRGAARELREAFAFDGVSVQHTFAVKAASLVPVLALLNDEGVGADRKSVV